jgi:NADPH:quinone reductase-like Zn-dependent oxidoreductase
MAVAQNIGLLKTAEGKATLTPIPVPYLRDDYIIVETIAVALNPTDWQNLDEPMRPGQKPTLIGCDAAGIVVEIGKNVTKTFKKGDRVAGMAHGGMLFNYVMFRNQDIQIFLTRLGNIFNPEDGTFAHFITMKGDITIHIPSSLSFEEAATLPCGIATIGLSMYRDLGLPLLTITPTMVSGQEKALLIYGGSSATGTLAIQFAKLSVSNFDS